MNAEQIQKFLTSKVSGANKYVKISFQRRDAIYGFFLTNETDYRDLSSKNFWRIVPQRHFDEYGKSGNANLSRIFHGAEMTRLSLLNDEF